MEAQAYANLEYRKKIMQLRERYKSTKDLWWYMVNRCKSILTYLKSINNFICCHIVGYLMPSLKQVRLAFIQDILCGKKKALRAKEVPARHIPNWLELSVKNAYK